jgi:hypothetical protein
VAITEYRLVARERSIEPTVIEVGGRRIGNSHFGLVAGPCTVGPAFRT